MVSAWLKSRFVAILILLAVFPVVWSLADRISRRDALVQLENQAAIVARQHVQLLESELARYRLLPVVLSEYGDLAEALDGKAETAARFSEKLALLAHETKASIIYAIDAEGHVVSSSNFTSEQNFVGQDFAFRPYFTIALAEGTAEYYGEGVLTRRPGLFLARRVGGFQDPVGVVVVKYEFEALMNAWASDPGVTLIVDDQDVILSATDPAVGLHVLAPLPEARRAEILTSGQFPSETLTPGRYRRDATGDYFDGSAMMTAASEPVSGTALELVYLLGRDQALSAAAWRAWLLALPAMAVLTLLGAAVWWRYARAAQAAAQRRALEEAVKLRTADLRNEIAERERADLAFRQAREELAQANRLASLGQVTAGLVHEINQPVATISTLAENARHHLAAGRTDRVRAALDSTIDLTTRIGTMTAEMRRFARRGQGKIVPVELDEVIDGVELILGDRLRKAGIALERPEPGLRVLAGCIRLEQVLVNLLQNALDALTGHTGPRIALIAREERGGVLSLIVADNGPGIDPDLADQMFHPFVTGKVDGLGLGLGIAQDIMRDIGGDLGLAVSPLGGAAFKLTMRLA